MSGRQDMSEHPDRDVEERLRTALRARARGFTVSPDAWERTLARRAAPATRLRSPRNAWRMLAPLAAAAAVVAIAAGLLIERGSPGPAGSRAPAASAAPSPIVQPSLSPTHPPAPKGLRVPTACAQTPPPPPAYTVTEVSAASMPAPARQWLQKAPAVTRIVRIDTSYRGDRSVAYLWFTHPTGRPLTLEDRIASLLPPGADLDTVHWDGAAAFQTSIPAGHAAQVARAEGNRLVTYDFGLARRQVASATMTIGGPANSGPALDGPTSPVPGLVISGHGFPANVYMAAYPATPRYGALMLRDATGKTVGTEGVNPFPVGTMCVPLAALNVYQGPHSGYAYASGSSLPLVASVTAVLPDGSQLPGLFVPGGGTRATGYFWDWSVRLAAKDANLRVKLLFKDAAGRVLGHLTTVPGKSPLPAIKR